MPKDRWIKLWKSIVDLKVEVTRLLDARHNQSEWELRESREKVDHLIKEFFLANVKAIGTEDTDLYSDLLGVYEIREFTYGKTLAELRKESLGTNQKPPDDLTCVEAGDRLTDLVVRTERHLRGLIPAWERFEVTKNAQDVTPHKPLLRAARDSADKIEKELDGFAWVKGLSEAYLVAKDQLTLLQGETTWLTHLAEKGGA